MVYLKTSICTKRYVVSVLTAILMMASALLMVSPTADAYDPMNVVISDVQSYSFEVTWTTMFVEKGNMTWADYSGFESWSWAWTHSPLNQNTLTVDELGTGKGWGDDRGYGECVTFKGGEDAGTPGSGFQVLDVRDHYSWARVGKDVTDWRRIAIGVEGPDGRPYVLDITHLAGGCRHALYNQAWAQRADAQLPQAAGQADDLSTVFFEDKLPDVVQAGPVSSGRRLPLPAAWEAPGRPV